MGREVGVWGSGARREEVLSAVRRLSPRARLVIESRFALDGREPLTFDELGRALDLPREGVRRLEREALARLRRRFRPPAR